MKIYINEFASPFKKSEQKRINKLLIKKIADIYDDPFSKWIEKNMYKKYKNLNLSQTIKDADEGDKDNLHEVFASLYIDYFLSKFDKRFYQRSITGNSTFDTAYHKAVKDYLTTNTAKSAVIEAMYYFFYQEEDIIELVPEAKDIKKTLRKGYNWVIAKGNKEKRLRYSIRDKVFDYIDVNKTLKRQINDGIMNLDVLKLQKVVNQGIGLVTALDLSAEIIMDYIYNEVTSKKIKQNDLADFIDEMNDIIKKGENFIEKRFKAYISLAYKDKNF